MHLPLTAERNAMPSKGGWKTHRLYGLNLTSDFAFANRLVPATGASDLTFTCVTSAPHPDVWEHLEPAYSAPPVADNGESDLLLYALDDCWVLRFAHVAD